MRNTAMQKVRSSSAEPHFYIALVLKGSEDQYLKLLRYVNGRNGARVIYQSKSLTYMRVLKTSGPIHFDGWLS